jgi:hypothetical protein
VRGLVPLRKTAFLRHLYLKTIILPRQAPDKHRENSKKCRFPYRRLEATELRDHELGCRGRIGTAAVASHLALAAAQIKDHTGVAFEGVDSFIGRQDVEDE